MIFQQHQITSQGFEASGLFYKSTTSYYNDRVVSTVYYKHMIVP